MASRRSTLSTMARLLLEKERDTALQLSMSKKAGNNSSKEGIEAVAVEIENITRAQELASLNIRVRATAEEVDLTAPQEAVVDREPLKRMRKSTTEKRSSILRTDSKNTESRKSKQLNIKERNPKPRVDSSSPRLTRKITMARKPQRSKEAIEGIRSTMAALRVTLRTHLVLNKSRERAALPEKRAVRQDSPRVPEKRERNLLTQLWV